MSKDISKAAINSYLETLLWSESTNINPEAETRQVTGKMLDGDEREFADGDPIDSVIDSSDLDNVKGGAALIEEAQSDLEAFRDACLADDAVGLDPFSYFDECQVAHDFALSRNGHGAGFFDGAYGITAKGPRGLTADPFGDETRIENALQSVAREAGTCGLDLFVDSTGHLVIATHG